MLKSLGNSVIVLKVLQCGENRSGYLRRHHTGLIVERRTQRIEKLSCPRGWAAREHRFEPILGIFACGASASPTALTSATRKCTCDQVHPAAPLTRGRCPSNPQAGMLIRRVSLPQIFAYVLSGTRPGAARCCRRVSSCGSTSWLRRGFATRERSTTGLCIPPWVVSSEPVSTNVCSSRLPKFPFVMSELFSFCGLYCCPCHLLDTRVVDCDNFVWN